MRSRVRCVPVLRTRPARSAVGEPWGARSLMGPRVSRLHPSRPSNLLMLSLLDKESAAVARDRDTHSAPAKRGARACFGTPPLAFAPAVLESVSSRTGVLEDASPVAGNASGARVDWSRSSPKAVDVVDVGRAAAGVGPDDASDDVPIAPSYATSFYETASSHRFAERREPLPPDAPGLDGDSPTTQIIVGLLDGTVVSLDANTGERGWRGWRFVSKSWPQRPAVLGTIRRTWDSIPGPLPSPRTGTRLWSFSSGEPLVASAAPSAPRGDDSDASGSGGDTGAGGDGDRNSNGGDEAQGPRVFPGADGSLYFYATPTMRSKGSPAVVSRGAYGCVTVCDGHVGEIGACWGVSFTAIVAVSDCRWP